VPTVHVRYIVNDVEAAVAFYTSHLGFTIMSKTPPAFAEADSSLVLVSGQIMYSRHTQCPAPLAQAAAFA
jgi:catechol 2,3-dioxygenase-like lactoylglutathione lyase family enzyme